MFQIIHQETVNFEKMQESMDYLFGIELRRLMPDRIWVDKTDKRVEPSHEHSACRFLYDKGCVWFTIFRSRDYSVTLNDPLLPMIAEMAQTIMDRLLDPATMSVVILNGPKLCLKPINDGKAETTLQIYGWIEAAPLLDVVR